jgi:hypothetical protein
MPWHHVFPGVDGQVEAQGSCESEENIRDEPEHEAARSESTAKEEKDKRA